MPPSAEHLLGTSQAGIDLYALTVEGTRVSILIGLVVGLVSVLIAAVYGCTMAYFGGKVDKVMLFILEALIMMPALLVVAVATSGGGNGLQKSLPSWLLLIIVLLVFSWMGTARLIRSLSMSLMPRDFVKAAQYMGDPAAAHRLAAPRPEHRLAAGPRHHPRRHRRHPRRGRVLLHRHRHQGPGREPGRADRPGHLPGLHLPVDVLGAADRHVPADRFARHDERRPPGRVRPQLQLHWQRQEKEEGPHEQRLPPPPTSAPPNGSTRRACTPPACTTQMRPAGAVLSVRDLNVRFNTENGVVHAVRGIDFDLMPGKTLGIVGESGSGKSVTSMAIMGLLPETAEVTGSVRLQGKELLGLSDKAMCRYRGNEIAMVFQDPLSSLTPVYTVGTQIIEALTVHNPTMSKQAKEARAVELLGMVGIPSPKDRLKAFPHEFSGGMRQRVMIAIAIANNPRVLIADEPTTALDVTIQAQVLEVLHTAQEETGAAVV